MIIEVSFKIVNSAYNKEYAEQYNWGEPSPDNMDYLYSVKVGLDAVKSIYQNECSSFKMNVTNEKGESVIIIINNVFHLCCELENGEIEDYFISKSCIKNIHTTKVGKGKCRYYFYLLDSIEYFKNITNYIDVKDLPKDFKEFKLQDVKFPNDVKSTLIEKMGLL